MPNVTLPNEIQDGDDLEAGAVMANFNAIVGAVNGGIDGGNIATGAPSVQTSLGGLSEGSSPFLARADHKHVLQGMEQSSSDPTSGLFVGREYFNTTNKQKRLCIAVSPAAWVTTGNLAAGDIPNHASRHASGAPDALPALAVDATMLSRTVYLGVPSGDISLAPPTNWVDIVTGVSPVVSGAAQLITLYIQVGFVNSHATQNPTVAFRVIDEGSNIIFQSKGEKLAVSGNPGASVTHSYVCAKVFTATPTLKLQGFEDQGTVTVNKNGTIGGTSTALVTQLQAVVG